MSKFILVDDDSTMNLVHSTTIKHHKKDAEVREFTSSRLALNFLEEAIESGEKVANFIFLDINMPEVNGFEFLQAFEQFPTEKTKDIKIFMITSSLDLRDREKAFSFDSVFGFVCKPITVKTLTDILTTTERRMDF
jgi:CheY-like chemotaxis protein